VQRDRCIHIVWVGGVWCLWQRPIIDNRETARSGAKKERERETRIEKVIKRRGEKEFGERYIHQHQRGANKVKERHMNT
jgi:hypothetical protein